MGRPEYPGENPFVGRRDNPIDNNIVFVSSFCDTLVLFRFEGLRLTVRGTLSNPDTICTVCLLRKESDAYVASFLDFLAAMYA